MAEIVPIPAVNSVIFDSENRVLLTRRSPQVREPGKWCLPGGHFDGGEDWVSAARREVREETGLVVLEEELLGVYSDPSVTVTEEPVIGKAHKQFLVVLFLVTKFSGEVQPNEEVDLWGWFGLDDLPEPLLRSHPVRIQDAFTYCGKPFVR